MTPTANLYRDGNPIYWLVNAAQKKGVRIIQLDPHIETKWPISAYTGSAGDEFLLHGKRTELVFLCQLTEDAISKFKILFEAWTYPDCNITKLDTLISSVLGY